VIELSAARQMVIDACPVLAATPAPVERALGRVTAEVVVADQNVPAFENSAMDGFALRARDTTTAPVVLRVVGTTMAGMPPTKLGPGEAVRVMTGAPLPSGADAVCMIEDTQPGGTPRQIVIGTSVEPGLFVRRPGDDLRYGQKVFDQGTTLGPGHLGVLATLGRTTVMTHPRPRVGVLSTGDELLEPPTALTPGRIRDANRPSLRGLIERADFTVVDLGVVGDDEAPIEKALIDASRRCDAIVISGGVSVGDADLVKVVLDRLCAPRVEWLQIAIKPAKPFAFGILADRGLPVFGVPGNPVSAMVSFELLVRPALRRMAGHRALDRPRAVALTDEPLRRIPDGKTHFVRVVASYAADGVLHVRSSGTQQSHVLHAMAMANALAIVEDGRGPEAGELVRVILLDLDTLSDPGLSEEARL